MVDNSLEPSSLPYIYTLMFQKHPDVVTVTQMCEMLGGISTKTAYKLLQANKIKYFKIGRAYKIPKTHIIDYLQHLMNPSPALCCDALVH